MFRLTRLEASGVEIEESKINKFRYYISLNKRFTRNNKVSVIHDNLLNIIQDNVTLLSATIIITYLLPDAMKLISPYLIQAIKNGKKLITNTWNITKELYEHEQKQVIENIQIKKLVIENTSLYYYFLKS